MKFTKVLALVLAFAGLSLTSCNEDTNNVTTWQMPGFINYSVDRYDQITGNCSGVAYNITFDYDNDVAGVQLSGVTLPNGQKYTYIQFSGLKFTQSKDGLIEINASNVMPESVPPTSVFEYLHIRILSRFVEGQFMPLTDISYKIADYTIYSLSSFILNQGTTTVKSEGQPDFVQQANEGSFYIFNFDYEKKLATLSIQGAKFASNMPALNMRFKNIPFSFTEDGKYSMAIDNLIPVIVGSDNTETEYPSFPISNLSCTTDCFNNMKLNFVCTMIKNPLQNPIIYNVNAVSTGN